MGRSMVCYGLFDDTRMTSAVGLLSLFTANQIVILNVQILE